MQPVPRNRPARPVTDSPVTDLPGTGPGGRAWAGLTVGTAVALAAVAVLPFPVAGLGPGGGYADVSTLGAAVADGLVHFWQGASPEPDPSLAAPVAFWARFHAVKAALAVPLLLLGIMLGRRIWSECVNARRGRRRAWFTLAGLVEAPLVLLAALLVVANVQGALAPLSSALGLLDVHPTDPAVATTLREIKYGLVNPSGRTATPALTRLVEDFTAYHVVMVWLGAIVTVCLVVVAARWWRRARGAAAAPSRRVRSAGATVALLSAAAFAVITAANLSTALHPAPALLSFFQGGA